MKNTIVLKQETADAIVLGYINESVKRAREYGVDISENVMELSRVLFVYPIL